MPSPGSRQHFCLSPVFACLALATSGCVVNHEKAEPSLLDYLPNVSQAPWHACDVVNARVFPWRGGSDNPWFPLVQGRTLGYAGKRGGKTLTLTRTVEGFSQSTGTKVHQEETLDGVTTRSNHYYVQAADGSVCELGVEFVDENDRPVDSHDAWRTSNSVEPHVAMPGTSAVGVSYVVAGVNGAPDVHATVWDVSADPVELPGGTFDDTLVVRETTAGDAPSDSFKTYAYGVGFVADEELELSELTDPPRDR